MTTTTQNSPITAATTARRDSLGVLFEYHAATSTLGLNAPIVSRKHAKYAVLLCAKGSMAPRTMKPTMATTSGMQLGRGS